jgi:signal transduction histidine kinase
LKKIIFTILLLVFGLFVFSQNKVNQLITESKKAFNSVNYQEGLDLALKALKEAEKSKNPIDLANANLQVGVAYYYNNQDKKEDLSYFYEAKKYIYKANIDSLKPRINHNIGAVYIELGELDSAEVYLKEVFSLIKNTEKYVELSKSCAVLVELYFQKDDYESALKFIEKAEKYAKMANSDGDYAFARIKRGLYHLNLKQYKESIPYFEEVKYIYENQHEEQGMQYVYRLLADATANSIDPKIALLYEDYYQLKDSIFKKESAEKLALYKTTFETEKKDLQIKLQNATIKEEQEKSFLTKIIFTVALVMILLIVFIFYLNFKHKQKIRIEIEKIEAKERERNRLAAELHDNVGSSVSFMSLKIDWLLNQKELGEENKAEITQLKETTQDVINGLRETLWTLNTKSISNIDLCDKLKVYIKKHLLCSLKIDDQLTQEFEIPNEDVLTLYRCSQEIINNINKHSKANTVFVQFVSSSKNELILEFKDDGIGFNYVEKDESYGLRNIKARMEKINGELHVNSSLGSGTGVKLIYKFSA